MQYADGWRLDVGADVDPGTINDPTNDYWEGFRNTVKFVKPDGYIVGEEWGIANSWLLGGEWDAVMNYQFSSAVLSLWRDTTFIDNDHNAGSSAGELAPLSMTQFDERILNLQERYAPEVLAAMLNLFGSHDTSRALFMLDHNTDQNDPALYQNPNYDWSDAISRLKGAVAVQMTMPARRPSTTVMKLAWWDPWRTLAENGKMTHITASLTPGLTQAARLSIRACRPRKARMKSITTTQTLPANATCILPCARATTVRSWPITP